MDDKLPMKTTKFTSLENLYVYDMCAPMSMYMHYTYIHMDTYVATHTLGFGKLCCIYVYVAYLVSTHT